MWIPEDILSVAQTPAPKKGGVLRAMSAQLCQRIMLVSSGKLQIDCRKSI